ncbi:MAG: ATP:cob(I)alamin adenosyltransferase [Erysipelotrichales bacterium]|nr:MAG: ATP:cob(I)alamin adenosyltransferase [Erysipelotrichales bacterium]
MGVMTKTGDNGSTGVFGKRIEKDSVLVETLGVLDELQSSIILVQSENQMDRKVWEELTFDLVHFCSLLAGFEVKVFDALKRIEFLESEITKNQDAFKGFIYPFDDPRNARFHWLRSIVRRAERQVVRLGREQDLPIGLSVYLNRLSDYVFTRMTYNQK